MKTHLEFAEQYRKNPIDEELTRIILEFINELKEIGLATTTSDRDTIAIFKQQNAKWKLFAKSFPHINIDGFTNLIKMEFPYMCKPMGIE